MAQKLNILKAKLLFPRTSGVVERERLNMLFSEIPQRKLTTIIAGAGYGKTTFVSQAETHLNLNTTWYRLDKWDRDLTVFWGYLIAGIQKIYPQFGGEPIKEMKKIQLPGWEPEALLTAFLADLEVTVREDLMIVLDDYHLVQASLEIRNVIQYLLEHFPPLVHLILVSRTEPELSLSRLRAMRDVLDITEDDLVLTPSEIQKLFLSLFKIPLIGDTLKIVHEKTGGWVSGLILLYHSLQRKEASEINSFLAGLSGSHKFISSYLEENVYNSLPEDTKDFLRKTSILSKVNPEVCDHLLGISNSRKTLTLLEEHHLFTFSNDPERREFYYHHLFQDFLKGKLEFELDRSSVSDLYHDIAVHFEENGEEEKAIEYYLEGNCLKDACRLLSVKGMELLWDGKFRLVGFYLKKIPLSCLSDAPRLQYLNAKFLELSGDPNQAIQGYKQAFNGFRKQKKMDEAAMCLKDLGLHYYFIGDFARAEDTLTELLVRIQDSPLLYVETLGLLTIISSFLGKMAEADQYAERAVSVLPTLKGVEAQGASAWIHLNHSCRYTCSGDFERALELAEMTLSQCRTGFNALLPLTYFQIAWVRYFQGRFSLGCDTALKGLDIAKKEGVKDNQYAWLVYALALNSLGLKKPAAAIDHAHESLRCFQKLGHWGQGPANRALYAAHAESGDMSSARQFLDSGLSMIKGLSQPFVEGGLKGDLADSLMQRGQLAEVELLLEEAEKRLNASKFEMSRIHRLRARYHRIQNRGEEAMDHLLKGLRISAANGFESWVVFEKSWIRPLLSEALSRGGRFQDHIQTLINMAEAFDRGEISSALRTLDNAPALRVRFLGKFRVFQGHEEIPAERWKGEKPKMLFKYLVFARKRGFIPKEVLLELLWPEQDAAKTLKRLNVAFSSLRRSLEPNLKRGTPSSYIRRKKGSYLIDLGSGGCADVDDFLNTFERAETETDAENAFSLYADIEKIYQGHFLGEDLYEEWCSAERERLKHKYLLVLERIAAYHENLKNYQGAVDYAEKYLEIDDCHENIYRSLMRCYAGMGNRGMVTRTFERCKSCLSRNLSCAIDKKTKDLYNRLASS